MNLKQSNHQAKPVAYIIVLVFFFFIIGTINGVNIYFDGLDSSGETRESGYPFLWLQDTETHYRDGTTKTETDINLPNFFINLSIYTILSSVIVLASYYIRRLD